MTSYDLLNTDFQMIELPPTIKNHYGKVQIAADVLHANDAPFLKSTSNHIHYRTCHTIDNLKADTLESSRTQCVATRLEISMWW